MTSDAVLAVENLFDTAAEAPVRPEQVGLLGDHCPPVRREHVVQFADEHRAYTEAGQPLGEVADQRIL